MAGDAYKYFRVEARELVDQLGSGLAGAEGAGAAASDIPRLLRLAHTLKGAARVVKQPRIANLAHEIEDRLAPFREGGATVPRDQVEAILGLLDAIGAQVGALAPTSQAAAAVPDEAFRTLRTDVAEMDELLDGIAESQVWLTALRRTAASIGHARRLAGALSEQLAASRQRAGPAAGGSDAAQRSAQNLQALVATLERGLTADIDRVDRELRQARSAGERLRLLPISTLFSSLERAVSDAARGLGKRAGFRGAGGDVRLDGHVLGALQAALVQAVRNAVAHGIESEAERRAADKPAGGSVVVEVARRGSRVAVTCRDDGRGVDLAAVRRALQGKGIPTREAERPQDLLRLLLEGGITTSSTVTDLSGRGVGLDVVREVTARLGGQATLRSEPGQGTTLELVVPVTLSSLEALMVEAAGLTSAIPVDAVRHTVRLGPSTLRGGLEGQSIEYEGTVIPFRPLAHALLNEGAADGARRLRSAVVVGGHAGLAAFGVERLVGRATLLVRPLPALAFLDPVVCGLSLDAEGKPRPVLDPDRLVEHSRGSPRAEATVVPRDPILVVDDSLTTRMLEQSILESAGYAVELASSGEEALERARRQRYLLFLVDVEMPGMDGFALLEHLRSVPELRGIPSLLVTSRNSPQDRARGVQAGASAYIVKSEFDQVALLRSIRELVG